MFVEELWSQSSKWYQTWDNQLLYSRENGVRWAVILYRKSMGSVLVVWITVNYIAWYADICFCPLRRHIRKIWFRNVQTTCLNLYVRCNVVALHNFCMAALRKYPKNRKSEKLLIFMAKLADTLQILMHIRFCSLRRHILRFLTEFDFAMCRRHVLTYTSDVTLQHYVIFAWQCYANTLKLKI